MYLHQKEDKSRGQFYLHASKIDNRLFLFSLQDFENKSISLFKFIP